MKFRVLVLLLAFAAPACKKTHTSNPGELHALIDDSCTQNPISFIEEEQSSQQKLYVFGPQDAEFRQQWLALQATFRTSGHDLNGPAKSAFVVHYVPHFVQGCKQFFAAAVQQCGKYRLGSPKMQRCLEPHNTAFRKYLGQSLKVDENGSVDLESMPVAL
jgi:hypothetical protein